MTEEVFIMSQERVKRPGHTRWYISSLLSGIIILNYFDRVAISVAGLRYKIRFTLLQLNSASCFPFTPIPIH